MIPPNPTDPPYLRQRFAPIATEVEIGRLATTGPIPRGLRGALLRNGPNPQFAPTGWHHWFFGDGMIHRFQFDADRVSYRNRWVKTPKWRLEHALGHALALNDPRLLAIASTLANTNVLAHDGHVLALEEGHPPFEIDATTLDRRGYYDFGGDVRGPFTAHPKIDPMNGEMVFFGYSAAGPFTPAINVGVIKRDGALSWATRLTAPFASMAHDFAVTQRWIVVPIFPLVGSLERAMSGKLPYAWEPERGTHIALIPRTGGAVRWFRHEPCYTFHMMNAYDDPDGRVAVDQFRYHIAPGWSRADGEMPLQTLPSLVRWTLDPNRADGGIVEKPLAADAGEFPRIDDRFATLPYRQGYIRTAATTDGLFGAGIAHIDHTLGKLHEWRPSPLDSCDEAVFVPREKSAPEGDGWLLTVVYRGEEDRSDLAVFDARDVASGPIALIHVPHRVPAGFHGNWFPA